MRALKRILSKVSEAVGEALPAGIIDPLPWIIWWIAMSLIVPLLAMAGVIGWPGGDL